jgi:hypothetical protein
MFIAISVVFARILASLLSGLALFLAEYCRSTSRPEAERAYQEVEEQEQGRAA